MKFDLGQMLSKGAHRTGKGISNAGGYIQNMPDHIGLATAAARKAETSPTWAGMKAAGPAAGIAGLGAANIAGLAANDSNLLQILLGLGGTAATMHPKLNALSGMSKAAIGLGSGVIGAGGDYLRGQIPQEPQQSQMDIPPELLMALLQQR